MRTIVLIIILVLSMGFAVYAQESWYEPAESSALDYYEIAESRKTYAAGNNSALADAVSSEPVDLNDFVSPPDLEPVNPYVILSDSDMEDDGITGIPDK